MTTRKLNEITGAMVRGWYEWLVETDMGCCHLPFAENATHVYSVCMGWHDAGRDGWKVAWLIGRQSHRNVMQCDLDLDFEMPYDPETGDVDDTHELVEPGKDWTAADWNAVAARMRSTARRVWRDWKREGA